MQNVRFKFSFEATTLWNPSSQRKLQENRVREGVKLKMGFGDYLRYSSS